MKKPTVKRIGILHPDLTVKGGAERKLLIYAMLLRSQYDITILCGNFDPATTFSEYLDSTPVVFFPYRTLLGKMVSFFKMLLYTRQYELLIANNHPSQLAAAIGKWLFKKPVVWFCNEPMLYLISPTLKVKALQWLEKKLAPSFDAVISNSRHTQALILNTIGVRSHVIYSGLDLGRFPVSYAERPSRPVKRLILVSRMEKHKHLDTLLTLFDKIEAEYPQVELYMVGDGSYQPSSRTDKIVWKGAVSEEEKIRLLCESNVFVFPTRDEPLGVTPLEAMACGLPVVAFNSGGVKETVVHGQTGFLADTGDEFVQAVLRLLNDESLCMAFGNAGMTHVHHHFSQENMTQSLRTILERLLDA